MIVKRLSEEKQTKGGLIIPDTAKEKPQQAKVIAVGTGKRNDGTRRRAFPREILSLDAGHASHTTRCAWRLGFMASSAAEGDALKPLSFVPRETSRRP
jgi:hypothetical protein